MLRSLAAAERTSTSAIYTLFGSRELLITAVVADAMAAYREAMSLAVEGESDPRRRVQRFAIAYLEFARNNAGLYRVLFVRQSPSELASVGETARSMFEGQLRALGEAIERDAHDPVTFRRAVAMWIELHGIATLRPAHPNFPWPSETDLIAAVVDRALEPVQTPR